MDLETNNQEVLDRVDEYGKSTDENNDEDLNPKSEDVRGETDLVEMVAVSTPVEQIALSTKSQDPIQSQSPGQSQHVDESDKVVSLSPKAVQDTEALVSQISEAAQDLEPDTQKQFSGFDLNLEVCYETVPEDPGTNRNSNQRLDFLDFDLNVAEDTQEGKMVTSYDLPSGEESSVANPRKPERLQWDLNSMGDDQNRPQSPYYASSSSKQPMLRNIDLNVAEDTQEGKKVTSYDFPSGVESSVVKPGKPERLQWDLNSMGDDQNSPQSPYHALSSSKQPMLRNIDLNLTDESNGQHTFISIFRARFPVKRKDNVNVDSSKHYGHHSMHGSPSHPLSMSMHMPMPYMVDPRGSPFAPQVMGSHPPFPFHMNMAATGAPSGTTGLGPPTAQANFGLTLNTGSMINGGLRQFFPQNVSEQASLSSVLGKRHEPDSGWQFFSVNKHQQPRWK